MLTTIEEFFGTLQESFIQTWRLHLSTSKYSSHIALEEFYEGITEKVDALIEAWISSHGKPGPYKNILEDPDSLNPQIYLETLRDVVRQGRTFIAGETELESMVDDILGLIDSTLYKLKNLTENRKMKSLYEYICESSKSFEDKIFDKIKKYLGTLKNNSQVDEDYLKFCHEVVDPVRELVREHKGTGSVTVHVWNDVIYIGWCGTSETYKDKDITVYLTNLPANEQTHMRIQVNKPAPKNGVSCECSEVLKNKILDAMHPSDAKLYS